MGGVAKAVNKILGGGGSNPSSSAPIAGSVTAPSQATIQETFDEQKNSERKGRKRLGAKKLQIPTQGTAGVITTGGTGLGTGV